jgi:TatD DNase family protein
MLEPYAAAVKGRVAGVMHCFGGSLGQALDYVAMGFLISIPCSVTYPANEQGRRLAREVPLDSLLVETDAPYLPPQSHRGRRNEPSLVPAAVKAIAAERSLPPEAVAGATSANAARVFGLSIPQPAATQ